MTIAIPRRAALVAAALPWLSARGAQGAEAASGPFGLTWGLSSDEVRKMGVTLTPSTGTTSFGAGFSAAQLPKSLSDMESAFLAFGFDDMLWRVTAVGKSLGPDPAGSAVIARYQDLASSLESRYGRGRETDERDTQMWKAQNEYLMSLKMGRAHRYTSFRTPTVDVELSIRAVETDKGYYLMIYEDRAGLARFQQQKKAREKEAL